MKQTFLLITFSLFAAACHTNEKQTDNNASSYQKADIKSIINGNWYEPIYINDIQKAKSPFQSQKSLATMVEINIDISKAIGDTLEVATKPIIVFLVLKHIP